MSNEHSFREQMWRDLITGTETSKEAELANTYDMPSQGRTVDATALAKPAKTVIKTAAGHDPVEAAFSLGHGQPVNSTPPKKLPQARLQPYVDVAGKEPKTPVVKHAHQRYALPLDERYPLDGFDQVKMASAYFTDNYEKMPIEVRREYAQNMVERADELGIKVSSEARHYAGNQFASPEHLKMALDLRRQLVSNEAHREVLDKVASAQHMCFPEDFALLLHQWDKLAAVDVHYDQHLFDPYLSIFEKKADPNASTVDPETSFMVGGEYVTLQNLVEFSKFKQDVVAKRFGVDFARDFTKSPKTVFDALPRPEQTVLLRMVNNSSGPKQNATTS